MVYKHTVSAASVYACKVTDIDVQVCKAVILFCSPPKHYVVQSSWHTCHFQMLERCRSGDCCEGLVSQQWNCQALDSAIQADSACSEGVRIGTCSYIESMHT